MQRRRLGEPLSPSVHPWPGSTPGQLRASDPGRPRRLFPGWADSPSRVDIFGAQTRRGELGELGRAAPTPTGTLCPHPLPCPGAPAAHVLVPPPAPAARRGPSSSSGSRQRANSARWSLAILLLCAGRRRCGRVTMPCSLSTSSCAQVGGGVGVTGRREDRRTRPSLEFHLPSNPSTPPLPPNPQERLGGLDSSRHNALWGRGLCSLPGFVVLLFFYLVFGRALRGLRDLSSPTTRD